MINKLFTPLLTFVLAFPLSVLVLSQEGSKPEEAKYAHSALSRALRSDHPH